MNQYPSLKAAEKEDECAEKNAVVDTSLTLMLLSTQVLP
jgi:hypothetical protein